MLDMQTKSEKLRKGASRCFGIFATLLVLGVGLVSVGAAQHVPLTIVTGQSIAITSPIFLAIGLMARRKLKKLGI